MKMHAHGEPVPDVAALFDCEPAQWGLRGDECLWRLMQLRFAQTPMPETVAELRGLIAQQFLTLTGKTLRIRVRRPPWA